MDGVYILAFGAHPDDVELSCSGTIISHIAAGDDVAIADLTKGELGTRGNAEIREVECKNATALMNVRHRVNLGFKDGFFKNDEEHQRAVVRVIRQFRPTIVLCNAISDRHPDHGRAAMLVTDSCFLSNLSKIITKDEQGKLQEPWKPQTVYHYIQDRYRTPDFVVDISDHMEKKMACIHAYKSQFFDPSSGEPETYISSKAFLESIRTRAAELGRITGVAFAEGFNTIRMPVVRTLHALS